LDLKLSAWEIKTYVIGLSLKSAVLHRHISLTLYIRRLHQNQMMNNKVEYRILAPTLIRVRGAWIANLYYYTLILLYLRNELCVGGTWCG